jgi:hypothetical protein
MRGLGYYSVSPVYAVPNNPYVSRAYGSAAVNGGCPTGYVPSSEYPYCPPGAMCPDFISGGCVAVSGTASYNPLEYNPYTTTAYGVATPGTYSYSPYNAAANQSLLSSGLSTTGLLNTDTGSWFTDPTQELISGLPNWVILAAVAAYLVL